MADSTQASDLDSTLASDLDSTVHLLQQDPASASPAVAIALIERWEHHLRGTAMFEPLSELKQAILNSNTTDMADLLSRLASETSKAIVTKQDQGSNEAAKAIAAERDQQPADMLTKLEQISQLLTDAGRSLP